MLSLIPESGELRYFGLDRITNVSITVCAFVSPAGFDAAAYYAQAFGIIRPDDEEPQEFVLSLTPTQGRYAQAFPLHPSQRLLSQSATAIRLSLRVYDTHDLRMELLSMGEEVEVLAPTSLREWMQQSCAAAKAYYSSWHEKFKATNLTFRHTAYHRKKPQPTHTGRGLLRELAADYPCFSKEKKQAELMVAQMSQPPLDRFHAVHFQLRQ